MAESESYHQRQERRDHIKVALETATLVAVVVYAGLTYCLLKSTQTQVAYSQRAWLGVDTDSVKNTPPSFEYGQIKTTITFQIENFSDSTVIREFDGAIVLVPADQSAKPIISETAANSPCGSESARTDITGKMIASGDAVFPHSKQSRKYLSETAMPPGMQSFTYAWLKVCSVYVDQTNTTRHTPLLYRSTYQEGAQLVKDGEYLHMPLEGWQLWDAQAD